MKTAIYAGSFDPITKGHLDILETGAMMFDKVIIAVAKNDEKRGFLTVDERINLIKGASRHLKNVEVDGFDGLTVNYARAKSAKFLLRGLRNSADFEYEMQLASVNNSLAPDIKTVFLTTKPELAFISSSAVREILHNGGDISAFVPDNVKDYLEKKHRI